MKIAITTPTGKVGNKLVEILLDKGLHDLVLLARDPGKLIDEASLGAKVEQGDLKDKEYVIRATRDADVLFWATPPDPISTDVKKYYQDLAKTATAASKANKIERVVFLSSAGAHLREGAGVVDAFAPAEDEFRDAVDNLIILRPTYFMENLLMSLDTVASDHNIYMPVSPQAKVAMIATKDIADAAAKAVTEKFTGQHVRELLGPREYSFGEAAEVIGKALGTDVKLVTVTPEQARDALTGGGVSEHMANQLVGLLQAINEGRLVGEQPRSEESTTPTTFEEFVDQIYEPAYEAMNA